MRKCKHEKLEALKISRNDYGKLTQIRKIMMIEQNTNYAYKMKYMTNPTFDKVRELSAKFYLELPQELKDELYEALHRGIDILDSEPQMTAYIFAFGKMHQAKLNYAFDKLSDNFFEQEEINIIDYGCGQAIGTMCYADFLRKNHYLQKVKTITLIEPSEICLKRAALHTSAFFPESEIKTVNKGFNDLNENDIICSEETPTLHILSNVLDILNFDIYNFAELIKTNLKGKNQFVCVAPYYNGNKKDNRMDLFTSKINGSNIITRKYKANEFMPEKEWTCKISCFHKNYDSFGKIGNSDLEIPISEGIEPHTIYYEAAKKLDEYRIKQNAISHDFANGNGKIKLKDKVSVIEMGTFKHCYDLMAIIIPNSVTNIGESAFYECSGLTSIVIPDSVTEIGNYAFYGCSGLTSINIPNSVTEIGNCLFDGCSELSSINIPDSVMKIGEDAFRHCSELNSINIPTSATEIGRAFGGCSGLTSIVVAQGNGKYDSRDNCNAIIETATNKLVAGCMNTIIPDSVTGIGYFAFYDCRSLTSINIPDSVTEIGPSAFSGCSGLTSVSIGNSVSSISDGAFYGCSNLASVTIPNSVTSIGNRAFYNCSGLSSVYYTGSVARWCGIIFFFGSQPLINAHNLYINNNLVTDLTIPNTVAEIKDYVFAGATCLKSIIISSSVTSIGGLAFWGCSGLEKISIPDSVININTWAFYGCIGLTELTIPNSVERIGEGAFEGCSGLTTVTYNATNCTTAGSSIFRDCSALTTVNIGENVTSIPNCLFYNCSGLTGTLTIPNSVTCIGNSAFYGCSGLTSATIGNSVTSIGESAFYGCSGLTSVTIGNSVTSIENYAFLGCSGLSSITIPNSVTSIGKSAFYGCSGLTSINIPDKVKDIGNWAFADCLKLTIISIPDSVIEIDEDAFEDCKSLKEIIIPKGTRRKFEELLPKYLWNKLIEK